MSYSKQELSRPEPICISDQTNLSIYAIRSYQNILNKTSGIVNNVRSLETTVETNNDRYKYYLYNRSNNQHIEINDIPSFEWNIGSNVNIKVGSVVLQSGENGGIYEQLNEVIVIKSTYNPNSFERTSQFETIDLPFWQEFIGMNVILCQKENGNQYIQGRGVITSYTYTDYSNNRYVQREALTVTVDIQSVNNVDFDEFAIDNSAVLYNVGTVLRVGIPSSYVTFKENTNVNSPVLGTLYQYLSAKEDISTTRLDVPGYCAAYDLIDDNDSGKIQVLPRPKTISGIIKNLKRSNDSSLQVYGVSYYPPR
jgi:hypothetical protein